jgi:membrane peptidoglycan carboxypeptidase
MAKGKKRWGRTLLLLFGVFFVFGFFCVSVVVLYVAYLWTQLPSPSQLGTKQVVESTKIFDRTGEVLLYEIHGEEKRTVIPFDRISPHLKNATLAAEDANFYHQPAFDWRAIIRAFLVNLRERRVVQGGSTITQQVAKNLFLTPERTLTRKVKELILAVQLESRFSKDELFSLYLNQVPYGSNAYGAEAAAQTFFSKSAMDLSIAEAALLAGLPQAPSYFSPWGSHVDELLARQDYVLDRMRDLGTLSDEEWREAVAEEVVLVRRPTEIKAYHFALSVRDYLVAQYGEELVTNGGLEVVTTLDWEMQQLAEGVVETGVERNAELYRGHNAALVAQDPKTGQILALVGSRDPFGDPFPEGCTAGLDCQFEPSFNVALQGLRQPGSALKPFAYMTAFGRGYTKDAILFDVPTEFASENPGCPPKVDFDNDYDECFHPHNFSDRFDGPVSLAQGLAHSMNVVSVKTLYLAGFDEVLRNLSKFGVSTLKERGRYGLSLVLGGGEVYLNELVNAYGTLSQDGAVHKQTMLLKVTDADGRVLEEYHDETTRAIGAQYPRMVHQILSDTDLRRGLFGASLGLTTFERYEVALKTGTTNDYRDAWSIGYMPSLVVGVWAGNNDNTPMQQQGGSILAAVPMWSEFFGAVIDRYEPEFFTRPNPSLPAVKPMLNGQYLYLPVVDGETYGQVHSLLEYVDPKDPTGPFPAFPEANSQYINWEAGVLEWARVNLSNVSDYNKPLPPGAVIDQVLVPTQDVTIANLSPGNGAFVKAPFMVSADIVSKEDLKSITMYFNGKLIITLPATGKAHTFRWFVFEPLKTQNALEVIVTNVKGAEVRASSVVYQ